MNENVKKILKEAITKKSKKLDLSGQELHEIPVEVKKMVWLEELNLDKNKIVELLHLSLIHI